MIWMRPISATRAPPPSNFVRECNLHNPGTRPTKDQEKVMANLKDIVATLAILSAGTLTLTGCKKTPEGETTNPDGAAAGDSAGEVETPAEGEEAGEGEASCSGEGEASCSGETPA